MHTNTPPTRLTLYGLDGLFVRWKNQATLVTKSVPHMPCAPRGVCGFRFKSARRQFISAALLRSIKPAGTVTVSTLRRSHIPSKLHAWNELLIHQSHAPMEFANRLTGRRVRCLHTEWGWKRIVWGKKYTHTHELRHTHLSTFSVVEIVVPCYTKQNKLLASCWPQLLCDSRPGGVVLTPPGVACAELIETLHRNAVPQGIKTCQTHHRPVPTVRWSNWVLNRFFFKWYKINWSR